MKVNTTQNSGNPAPVQPSEANVTDGTSNTVMFSSSTGKTEKPFSKDSFENFRFERGLPSAVGESPQASPKACDAASKEIGKLMAEDAGKSGFSLEASGMNAGYLSSKTSRDEDNGIESVPVKKSFMDYTDDDGTSI